MRYTMARAFIARFLASLILLASILPPLAAKDADSEERIVSSYLVDKGRLAADPGKEKNAARIWAFCAALIPPSILQRIGAFELFAIPEDSEIVSDAGTFLMEDGRSWAISLNEASALEAIDGKDPAVFLEFGRTIIHELAHVVSLSEDQMTSSKPKDAYVVDEGTLRPDSWLASFNRDFWLGRYPEWRGPDSAFEDAEALSAAHPGDFVTDYAATGPIEDFAESFSAWVTSAAQPAASMKGKKIAFFSAYPELAAWRSQMRKALRLK
jgi:hypothetical protein